MNINCHATSRWVSEDGNDMIMHPHPTLSRGGEGTASLRGTLRGITRIEWYIELRDILQKEAVTRTA